MLWVTLGTQPFMEITQAQLYCKYLWSIGFLLPPLPITHNCTAAFPGKWQSSFTVFIVGVSVVDMKWCRIKTVLKTFINTFTTNLSPNLANETICPAQEISQDIKCQIIQSKIMLSTTDFSIWSVVLFYFFAL